MEAKNSIGTHEHRRTTWNNTRHRRHGDAVWQRQTHRTHDQMHSTRWSTTTTTAPNTTIVPQTTRTTHTHARGAIQQAHTPERRRRPLACGTDHPTLPGETRRKQRSISVALGLARGGSLQGQVKAWALGCWRWLEAGDSRMAGCAVRLPG